MAAVLLVVVVVSLALNIYQYSFPKSLTVTRTSAQTATETTVTSTNNIGVRVYELTFRQVRYCGQFNIMPWAVTLNGLGLTEVEPSNQSLPLPTNTFSTIVLNQNLTRIAFLVPSGTYSYTVSGGAPPGGELYPGSGTVEVKESDVFVNVGVSLSFTCTS